MTLDQFLSQRIAQILAEQLGAAAQKEPGGSLQGTHARLATEGA